MASKHQVDDRLKELGMAWAGCDSKHTSPNDPMGAQARGEKTYHVHPDKDQPEVTAIQRFRTLKETLDYCDAVETARALSADGYHWGAQDVMADFWASIDN